MNSYKNKLDKLVDTDPLAKRIIGNVRVMNDFRKMYNSLCGSCRLKLLNKSRKSEKMKLQEYCEKCQETATYYTMKARDKL